MRNFALRSSLWHAIISMLDFPFQINFESRMRLRAFLLTAGIFVLSWSTFAQKVDLRNDRVAMTELAGPWRFHAGDEPAWATPSFDDSGWSLVQTDKGWSRQGYAGYGGTAWYRLDITLPPQPGPLSFYIQPGYVSCQVFANGRLIGQHGGLPPDPAWVTSGRLIYAIPGDVAPSRHLQLAIRVWEPEKYAPYLPGGLTAAPRLGDVQEITRWRELQDRQVYWQNSASIIELVANLIGALASLGMFLLRRKEREYFWFGLFLLNWSVFHILEISSAFQTVPFELTQFNRAIATTLGLVISLEFFALLLKQPRNWLYLTGDVCAIVVAIGYAGAIYQPDSDWGLVLSYGISIVNVCVATLIYRAWRGGSRDAGILLIPTSWTALETITSRLASIPYFSHQAWAQAFYHYAQFGIWLPFPYYAPSLRGDITNLVVLIVLILRYARSRADEERLESELEAARTVQKVLIPSEFPVIPGFQVEAVYKPASQVGGDFFQVIGVANGSALVVVGDVSGKGMPAAMMVSLLVGTFRTLAHYTRNPGEILHAMNYRMMARSSGGFTTCVVLCVDPDGNVTAANAGHLSPYVGDQELTLENSLPLGLDARSVYAESKFRLKPGEQITLLTDGVPEARNADGELFGFENTAAISAKSADAIAEAAARFGQNDDVTVVKLTWQPALLSASAAIMFSSDPTSY
jgi:hypothetical protein